MELIDINAYEKTFSFILNDTDQNKTIRALRAGMSAALLQPRIDAIPVVHGKWVRKGEGIYCSVCDVESAYNAFGGSKFSKFCPNCGAKMYVENSVDNVEKG